MHFLADKVAVSFAWYEEKNNRLLYHYEQSEGSSFQISAKSTLVSLPFHPQNVCGNYNKLNILLLSNGSLMDSGVTCKLPCDIIEEIPLRLDAKSLIRCSCVCKSWLSLISHPSFKIRHLEHQIPGVLLHLDTPLDNLGRFSFHSSESFDQIWSPICPIDMFNSSSWCLVGSQNGEPLTNDFKVVVVASRRQYNCVNFCKRGNQVGVYSFRSDSWKTIEMPGIFSNPSAITHPHPRRMNSVLLMALFIGCSSTEENHKKYCYSLLG
ncbi:F-box domain containing protein [Parasponia andersonii]|uniref:F-box domain containing protein n=1 Tax=Parasponia andersonii TaxID=3476 RepID=A0A2P5DVC8_PARAD|nr:F-box domain containing protein [Parasponia andersonii]